MSALATFWNSAAANARQAYMLALTGAIGALIGLYIYVEMLRPFPELRQAQDLWWLRDVIAGVALGGAIGFVINGLDPLRDGAFLRLANAAAWGAVTGALGGAVGLVVGESVLVILQGGPIGRAISWAILGLGLGLSQGLASRSRQRLVHGLIGGGLGGFIGGFLFESLRVGLGNRYDLSQSLGIVILGAGLGLFLALVEQVMRKAWVRVLNGRQEGRAYLLATGTSRMGLDEWAEVGLFGDSAVGRRHAEIERAGDGYTLRALDPSRIVRVNGQDVHDARTLVDGDRLEIGHTRLVFHRR